MKILIFCSFFCFCATLGLAADPPTDVEIGEQFLSHISTDPLLMEMGGAKIERLEDGRIVVLAVGMTPIKGSDAAERMRQVDVARAKAQKALVAKFERVQVDANTVLVEATATTTSDTQNTYETQKLLIQQIRVSVSGIVKSLPDVGTWKSPQRDIFYLAIGKILTPDEL